MVLSSETVQMSSRALRKLQQQQELEAEKAKFENEKEASDNENEDTVQQPGHDISERIHTGGARAKMSLHKNPFDLVRDLEI